MMPLAQWLAALEGAGIAARIVGDADTVVAGVSIDTRTIAPGAMYVALRGARFDGHDFAAEALRRGAAALMAERELPLPLPQILVADAHAALGAIASYWRSRFAIPLIAVAGSNGKTTTTQMIASVFAHAYGQREGRAAWFATRGNRNNEIGVPLMLLELGAAHRAAVLEMGMNHPGEIAVLCGWARPTVALVTNAQREHQEFLDSVEATARENGSAIAVLPDHGTAVFPGDDACAPIWRALAGARPTIEFVFAQGADEMAGAARPQGVHARIAARACAAGMHGALLEIATPWGEITAELAVGGKHNARNALAAAAACLAIGIAPEAIERGLAAFRPVAGRGVLLDGRNGATLIDDSYNANPDSVRAAIDLLAGQPGGGAKTQAMGSLAGPARILILGDMGETGSRGAEFHREVGTYARARGIDRLLTVGELAKEAAAAFGGGGAHFDTVEELIAAALALAQEKRTFLVKGSRFMQMERVVSALRRPDAPVSVESDLHA